MQTKRKTTAQAMVEFALALPILLLVIYGLLEAGRLLFIYASVVTAARQAARYGSASGDIGNGTTYYYQDCSGIEAAAKRVAFIQRFDAISIAYDKGPGTPNIGTGCPYGTKITDNEHRIKVTVTTQWTPIVRLVPFTAFPITSTSNRTIITGVSIAVDQSIATLTGGGTGLLTLVKSSDRNTYTAAGQMINYTYTLTNPGSDPIVNIVLSDSRNLSITCPGGMPVTLAGGASITCTASDITTQAEVDAAETITNVGTATGLTSANVPVTAQSTRNVTFQIAPVLTLSKVGAAPQLIAAGQSISYTFTLKNDGNVPLKSPYVVTDALVGTVNCSGATSPLPVGASTTCTGNYTLRNADINRGYVDNSATATAHYGTGSSTVTSNVATYRTVVPELFLAVSANVATISTLPTTITFTFTLTNRTGSGMNNITITDNHGANGMSCLGSLAGGAQNSCTRNYTVTQTDIDASTVFTETATATAQGNKNSNQAGVTIQITQTPALTLTKTASPSQPASGNAFTLPQNITYTYSIKNTGNVTVSAPFGVTDNKLGTVCTVSSGTLAPNATLTPSCTKTYALTQADLDNGTVINTATATAVFAGATVTSPQATATVKTFTQARMALLKTASVTFFTAKDQPISYTYAFKNTGGQVLTLNAPYTLTDDKIGNIVCGTSPITVPLGGTVGCKVVSYSTTDLDVAAKQVKNTVTPAAGSTTTPVLTNSPSATVTIPLFICDSTTVFGSGPIPDGSDVTWTITDNTGLAIHIASATVYWNNTARLTQVFLNSISIWSGSGSSGILLTGGPWILNNGTNPMRLQFNSGATGIRVVIGFTESACNNLFVYSSP